MRRVFIAAAALFVGAAILAHNRPATSSKVAPLVFVFLHVDREQGVAYLRPMIAPDIGVQLDSGSRELKRGTVLRCMTSIREHAAIVDGQVDKVSELVLDCLSADEAGGDYKCVVKGLDFSSRTK